MSARKRNQGRSFGPGGAYLTPQPIPALPRGSRAARRPRSAARLLPDETELFTETINRAGVVRGRRIA